MAVDGPSGSGKSTISRRLATALDATYLDTGAMYRAATWAVLQAGVDPHDGDSVLKIVESTKIDLGTNPHHPTVTVDGHPVDEPIRGALVTKAVSAVAAIPGVRALLVQAQRDQIHAADAIVVEGRDIGTVVATDAVLKVYLTADAEERARRRSRETNTDQQATSADLARRDAYDSSRTTDPLRPDEDAVTVDTTTMTIDEVVAHLLNLLAATA
ncbi:MAG: (d)CMP kinase [Longispora sp.]|nr:(d)CMP kinase [Longispora sp. (in: high G+C Gram-positive bacteria)]